jgi:hypothetical protein
MAFDPETTVGRVKELVWNTWPNGTLFFTLVTPLYPRHTAAWAIWFTKCAERCRGDRPDCVLDFNLIYFIFLFHSFNRTLSILVDVSTFRFPLIDVATTQIGKTNTHQHPPICVSFI